MPNVSGRVPTWPMSSQFSKSRERWIGMPGRYSKLDVARNHSSPTRTTLGSGWNPFSTGL